MLRGWPAEGLLITGCLLGAWLLSGLHGALPWLVLAGYLAWHVHHLIRLQRTIADRRAEIPESFGIWQVVFDQLYGMMKDDPSFEGMMQVTGFSFVGSGENVGMAFIRLKDWDAREETAPEFIQKMNGKAFVGIKDAQVFFVNLPTVQGLGQFGGFDMWLQDRAGAGQEALMEARNTLIGAASADKSLVGVRPNTLENSPQLQLKVDRVQAQAMGVSVNDVSQALQTLLGSRRVSTYLDRGEEYRVIVQADEAGRSTLTDLQSIYVRARDGSLVPLSNLVTTREVAGPRDLGRFNKLRAITLSGGVGPGYSLGEADLLRRAMGKKKKEEMDKQRIRFVDGAKEKGVDAAKASSIFDLVQKFAGYGFNKSHAAAYAYIAYQTAWLKANYPAELLAASMSLDRANTDKLAIFLKEARRTELEVRPPHINYSEADFSVKDGAIVYALSAVKNVGEGAMAHIADERAKNGPFKDLIDFAERVDLKQIGKRSLENLARAGALDGLCASRAQAFASAELLLRTSAAYQEEQQSDQGGLFALDDAPALAKPKLPAAEEWTPQVRLDEERSAVGFYFSGHPLDDYEKELKRLNVITYTEAQARAKVGRAAVQMAGVIRTVRFRRSKTGKPFAWVELSDQSGEFEITVFSETLNASRDLMESGSLVLVGLTVEERDGDVRFTCETMRKLDEAAAATVSQLRVSVTSPDALDGLKRRLASVRPASARESGSVVVVMRLPETGREVDLALPGVAACTPAMRGALRSINGVADVELI